jgi:VCBS repeat-containing protein
LHRNQLTWQPPNAGTVDAYLVRRAHDPTGIAIEPTASSLIHAVATTDGATLTWVDNEELPDGERFLYFVQGSIADVTGGPSNFAILTAENSAPVANNDTFTTALETPVSGNVLANDTDVDSAASSLRAVLVTEPSGGSVVLNSDGSFTYTPSPRFKGTDTFTYLANNGTWRDTTVSMSADSAPATVTILVERERGPK